MPFSSVKIDFPSGGQKEPPPPHLFQLTLGWRFFVYASVRLGTNSEWIIWSFQSYSSLYSHPNRPFHPPEAIFVKIFLTKKGPPFGFSKTNFSQILMKHKIWNSYAIMISNFEFHQILRKFFFDIEGSPLWIFWKIEKITSLTATLNRNGSSVPPHTGRQGEIFEIFKFCIFWVWWVLLDLNNYKKHSTLFFKSKSTE